MLGFEDHHNFSCSAFLMEFKAGQKRHVLFYRLNQLRSAVHQQACYMQSIILHCGYQAPPITANGVCVCLSNNAVMGQLGPGGPRNVSWLIQTMKP